MALKIYIQDLYRATPTASKYVYRYFSSISAKNIALHGTLTQLHSVFDCVLNFELSDPTGSVHVYYNAKKSDRSVSQHKLSQLCGEVEQLLTSGHEQLPLLLSMRDAVVKTQEDQCEFKPGAFVSVTGDVFVDGTRGVRMLSAYECSVTSPERELVWLRELHYLYDEYYLREDCDSRAVGEGNSEIHKKDKLT